MTSEYSKGFFPEEGQGTGGPLLRAFFDARIRSKQESNPVWAAYMSHPSRDAIRCMIRSYDEESDNEE